MKAIVLDVPRRPTYEVINELIKNPELHTDLIKSAHEVDSIKQFNYDTSRETLGITDPRVLPINR